MLPSGDKVCTRNSCDCHLGACERPIIFDLQYADKENIPVAGKVMTQVRNMFLNVDQLTAFVAFIKPTHTTEPILQCVVLTGKPILLQANTVKALPSSIAKPLKW